jgi:4-hydroxy-tetrahydrodipicolinate synthase
MSLKLTGVGVALVTPFTNENKVDYPAFEKLINHVIEGGINYLVVQGTTGETPTLTEKEKTETLAFAIKINAGRLPIVFGYGGNNTQALIDGFSEIDFTGVDAVLCASPYYNKPNQEGIYQHYKMLNKYSSVPIIVYNVPGRTSSNILPSTLLRMANDFDKVIAVKEASGNIEQKAAIAAACPKEFTLLSGDDAQIVAEIAQGTQGVISVIANALPNEFSRMVNAALSNDYDTARPILYKMLPIIDLLFADGNPAGIKAALNVLGICEENVRLPLIKANRAIYKGIKDKIEAL